jgi:hypothetical protein
LTKKNSLRGGLAGCYKAPEGKYTVGSAEIIWKKEEDDAEGVGIRQLGRIKRDDHFFPPFARAYDY